MQPDQMRGGFSHRLAIQHMPNLPDKPAIMGNRGAARNKAKQVAALYRRKPGMKGIFHRSAGHDRYGQGPQMCIDCPGQPKRIPCFCHITMRHLAKPMHAGIGAPCCGNRVWPRLQLGQGSLYRALNRGLPLGLTLPAVERPALIFDFQRITWHSLRLSCGLCADKAFYTFPPLNRRSKRLSWVQQARKGRLVLGEITDGLSRGVENALSGVSEALFEPVIRLGVTGLSRAGKTVFITSLVANLLDRGRMPQFSAAPRIETAFLQPQPDDTLPRFDYETHLAALTGATPHWPASTRAISELRLSLRVQPSGFFGGLIGGLTGPRTIHLDIIDYPGEWLLDLSLMGKTYADWSEATLSRIAHRTQAADFMAQARAEYAALKLEEPRAQALAASFTSYLQAARAAGWSDCTPGRFLLPGDLAGSPVLTFAPLPKPGSTPRGSLWREMDRRFEAYKSRVVRPFFRDHFARIDRQVVLMDVLGAIHAGPMALEDMRRTMAEILGAFRPGQNGFLSSVLLGKRVDKILFAATKADHLHHSQHSRLTAITEALLREARDRAAFAGAETRAMSLAALRATVEETRSHGGESLDLVRGTLLETGKQAAMFAGVLPEDPNHLLGPARKGEAAWLDADYSVMSFAPARLTLRPGEGPPHIRLDRAAEFLLTDRLG